MDKKSLVLIGVTALAVGGASGQWFQWTEKQGMPSASYGCGAVSDSQYVYLIGGVGDSTGFYRYDPEADDWEELPNLPQPHMYPGTAYHDGKIYLCGGCLYDDTLYIYDIVDRQWTRGSEIPGPERYAVKCAVIGESIYTIGGTRPGGGYLDCVYMYDITANTWLQKASLPEARSNGVVAVVDDKVYYFGGWPSQNSFYCYDPAQDIWTILPSMNLGRGGLGGGAIGKKLFACGGGVGMLPTSSVEVYDLLHPETGWQWDTQMQYARWEVGSAVCGGRLHIFGGDTLGRYQSRVDIHEVAQFPPFDVSAESIDLPEEIDVGVPVEPWVTVKNCSTYTLPIVDIRLVIWLQADTVYDTLKPFFTLQGNDKIKIFFPIWTPDRPGTYDVAAWTELLEDVDFSNDTVRTTIEVVGIAELVTPSPQAKALRVFPNPLAQEFRIEFSLAKEEFVSLKLFDAAGRLVKRLMDDRLKPGQHSVWVSTKDLQSGVYFIRLEAGGTAQMCKVSLIR